MTFHLYNRKKADYGFHTYAVIKEHDKRVPQSYCRRLFLKADLSMKSQMSLNRAKTEEIHYPYLFSSWQLCIHIILPFHKQILSE